MSFPAYQTFADHYGHEHNEFVTSMTPPPNHLGTKGISHQNAPYEFMNTDYAHLKSETRAFIPGNMYESHGHMDSSVHGYIGGKPWGRKSRPANQAYAGRTLFDPESCGVSSDFIPEQTTIGGLPHAFDASKRPDTGGILGHNSHDSIRSAHYFHALQHKLSSPIGLGVPHHQSGHSHHQSGHSHHQSGHSHYQM